MSEREYLGDGLYVEVSGDMVRLFTERPDGVHEVFLEPDVLTAFIDYLRRRGIR